jgi:hypothetical protein
MARANSSMAAALNKTPVQSQVYQIRQAEIRDIQAIDHCNRQNLPENYDYEFFQRHLRHIITTLIQNDFKNNFLTSFFCLLLYLFRLWPELSLIAESSNKELIGYTLGKAEEIIPRFPSVPMRSLGDISSTDKQKNGFGFQLNEQKSYDPKYCGSLIVDEFFLFYFSVLYYVI